MKIRKIVNLIPLLPLSIIQLPLTACSPDKDDVYDTLTNLDYVTKVDKVKVDYTNRKVYDVWFEQPLDWNDTSIGTFQQRLRFSFAGYEAANEMFVWGYDLNQLLPVRYTDFEEAERYNANTLRMEFRFYGLSCPSDISDFSFKYWEYLTVENAANDFHRIFTSFKKSFTGKWIMAGASKGGFTVNVQAMMFPEDANIFVSYVAPKGNDIESENMYNFTFSVGKDRTILKPYRQNLAKFLYYAIKHEDSIVPKYFEPFVLDTVKTQNSHYTDYFWSNIKRPYEVCVGEFAIMFWQFEQDLDQLKNFNELPDGEDKEKACFDLLNDLSTPTEFDINEKDGFAYYNQAYRQMGEHKIIFDPMIDFINEELGGGSISRDNFTTKQSDEDMLWWRLLLLPHQITHWHYDNSIRTKLEEWYKSNTRADVIMIYGSCDPWTSMSLSYWSPSEKSDKIHVYFGDDDNNPYARSHRVRISELSKQQQDEIWSFMDEHIIE